MNAAKACQQLAGFGQLCVDADYWRSSGGGGNPLRLSRQDTEGLVSFVVHAAREANEPEANKLDAFDNAIDFFETEGLDWLSLMVLKGKSGELLYSGRKDHAGLEFMRVIHRIDRESDRVLTDEVLYITDVYLLDLGYVQLLGVSRGTPLDRVVAHADELHVALDWAVATRNLVRRP